MFDNPAENRELTLAESINQRNPLGVCYLALTFGTLLSSQGADAQRPCPRGLRRRRLVPCPPRRGPALEGPSRRPPAGGRARRTEKVTSVSDGCQTARR